MTTLIALALLVQDVPSGKLHVGWAIIAPVAGALHRAQLREARFPIAKDVLGDSQLLRQFADGP